MKEKTGKKPKFSEDPLATTEYSTSCDTEEDKPPKTNVHGQVKTSRWNRPKRDVTLKDLEVVPTRRSQRISNMKTSQKKKVCKWKSLTGDFRFPYINVKTIQQPFIVQENRSLQNDT